MPSLLDVRRTAAALVAVALAAALIAFAFIVSDSFATQLTASARASVGDADVVVLPQRGQELDPDSAQKIAVAPGVARVRPYIEGSAWIDRPGVTHDTHAFVLDTASDCGAGVSPLTLGRLMRSMAGCGVRAGWILRLSWNVVTMSRLWSYFFIWHALL